MCSIIPQTTSHTRWGLRLGEPLLGSYFCQVVEFPSHCGERVRASDVKSTPVVVATFEPDRKLPMALRHLRYGFVNQPFSRL